MKLPSQNITSYCQFHVRCKSQIPSFKWIEINSKKKTRLKIVIVVVFIYPTPSPRSRCDTVHLNGAYIQHPEFTSKIQFNFRIYDNFSTDVSQLHFPFESLKLIFLKIHLSRMVGNLKLFKVNVSNFKAFLLFFLKYVMFFFRLLAYHLRRIM